MQRGDEEVCWFLYGTMHVGCCGKKVEFLRNAAGLFRNAAGLLQSTTGKAREKAHENES